MNELMLMDEGKMGMLMRFAEQMAKGVATLPAHLRNNPGDCLAIAMQSTQWGMNPFAVAQKTHITQGGALGYEAQLISAVVTSIAPIDDRPEYTFIGDWNKVLGKVEERKSDKGGKYYVATYTKADEAGLGVIVSCRLRGESQPREVTVMMSQAYPRFSTQWATDPQQQICYLAIRKWARRYTPDVILGVYSPDEMAETQPMPPRKPIDMGPAEVIPPKITDEQQALLDHISELLAKITSDAEALNFWVTERDNFPKNSPAYVEFKDAVVRRREEIAKQATAQEGGEQ
jgi:hypothetical protein